MSALSKNAYFLVEALFVLFLLMLCTLLLYEAVFMFSRNGGWVIEETIQKEWFYHDGGSS